MSHTACILVLLIVLTSVSVAAGAGIRFYTGNLSVGNFTEYWGTGKPGPGDSATPEFCDQMKSVSVSAVCDYLAWCLAEKEPAKWDWSIYDKNEKTLHANGLQYNVFCWLHFPPKWFMETPDYVPYRCAEHDQPVQQMSLWAPGTVAVYDRFYKELAAHFGDKIDFLRLATPSEYGEIGYPNGMTNWLVKQEHVHPGFWCNDRYAQADFKTQMEKRYQTISALNKAWGTSFESFEKIEFPAMARARENLKDPMTMTPGERRWILDFVGWYYDSQAEFVRKAVGIVRKYFPGKEIIVSMGYGSQNPVYGNDDVGIAKLCKELKIACQTPGNSPYFAMKSLASPCYFYGAPYFTEPPGGMDRNAEVNRIWSDASCGTQTYFDYPQNLLGAKDLFTQYKDYLDGKQAIVDVAVFFPTTEHRLRNEDWPKATMDGASAVRSRLDYDLVDERMIRDGALSRYKVLVMCDGRIMEKSTLEALDRWLVGGGILVCEGISGIETVEGDRSIWERIITRTRDRMIEVDPQRVRLEDALLRIDLPHLIDAPMPNIAATLFPDRILYLNSGEQAVDLTVSLRRSDFRKGGRTGVPSSLRQKLYLDPHSIAHIELE